MLKKCVSEAKEKNGTKIVFKAREKDLFGAKSFFLKFILKVVIAKKIWKSFNFAAWSFNSCIFEKYFSLEDTFKSSVLRDHYKHSNLIWTAIHN